MQIIFSSYCVWDRKECINQVIVTYMMYGNCNALLQKNITTSGIVVVVKAVWNSVYDFPSGSSQFLQGICS